MTKTFLSHVIDALPTQAFDAFAQAIGGANKMGGIPPVINTMVALSQAQEEEPYPPAPLSASAHIVHTTPHQ